MFYNKTTLDKLAERRTDNDFVLERLSDPSTVILPIWRGKSLVKNLVHSTLAEGLTPEEAGPLMSNTNEVVMLGELRGRTYFGLDVSRIDKPNRISEFSKRGEFQDLREVRSSIPPAEGKLLTFGCGIMNWHEAHTFCSRCGGQTQSKDAGHRRKCIKCKASHYPRLDPAVIMLVRRGDKCLLGHNKRRPAKWFSCFAGFVEVGETLEEAVAREVEEEAGVRVSTVKYFASQPWPFPSSLMLGYFADFLEGEPKPDMEEIIETRWFNRDEIQNLEKTIYRLPPADSMARQLITAWAEGRD